ncbi:DUF317 domain-containing protein [Streptomyces sp. H27-D2]|uniref:DUF317 domain-containing protein n=1 Tax=Streptomyces sp. H27-D2 TaxID=3046304 RepID=UPI003FA6A545
MDARLRLRPQSRRHAAGGGLVRDRSPGQHPLRQPRGRAYVGWFPETPDHHRGGTVGRTSVTGARQQNGWTQTLSSCTLSEAVSGFVAELVDLPVGVDGLLLVAGVRNLGPET